jgi:hypothetical protein
MANTIIQIKRSTTTATPASLNVGELAYSYSSNIAFIGTSDDAGVLPIGGNFYVERTNSAFTIGTSAFGAANTANVRAVAAFGVANTANVTSVAAFDAANTANIRAVAAFASSNAVNTYSNSTYVKLTAASQTITGDLTLVGNLNFSGNTSFTNVTSIIVNDPLIYLAGNNTSDIVDIGFFGNYVNATGSNVHTGLYREHADKQYYLFQGYDKLPDNNHIGALANNMTLAVLNADLKTSNLVLGGTNTITWITSAFAKANAALANATGTFNGTLTISNDLIVTGNATFDGGTLYVDAINNEVGIGTTNPTSNLHVIGTANITGNLVVQGVDFITTINSINANASNASLLSTGTVPSGRITGSYTGITGVGTLTAGVWNGSTITVPYGGTGITTATANGVILGSGVDAFRVTAAGTDGQVLQVAGSGAPAFGHLDGGAF